MQIHFINVFFFFCYGKRKFIDEEYTESESSEEYMSSSIPNQDDITIELLETCYLMMQDQATETAKTIKELCSGELVQTVPNLLHTLLSQLKSLEMTYYYIKELTAEQTFGISPDVGLAIEGTICLCSDTKFCSEIHIAKDGFEKVTDYIIKNEKSLVDTSDIVSDNILLFINWFKIFSDVYSQYNASLEDYINSLFEDDEDKDIDFSDKEYKIFLRQKFFCLLNSFISILDHFFTLFMKKDMFTEDFDFDFFIRRLFYKDSSLKSHCFVDQHIEKSIDMYFFYCRTFDQKKSLILCLGSYFQLKNANIKLIHLINTGQDVEECSLNHTLVDEFRSFIALKELCRFDILYNEFIIKMFDMLQQLDKKLNDHNTSVRNIQKFFLKEIKPMINVYEVLGISELLRWICNVTYFVQEFVLGAKKTNFNIFLGFACIELNFWLVLTHENELLINLKNEFLKWQTDNLGRRDKDLEAELRGEINVLIGYLREIIALMDLLYRGWFIDFDSNTCCRSHTGQTLESELIQYMVNYKLRYSLD